MNCTIIKIKLSCDIFNNLCILYPNSKSFNCYLQKQSKHQTCLQQICRRHNLGHFNDSKPQYKKNIVPYTSVFENDQIWYIIRMLHDSKATPSFCGINFVLVLCHIINCLVCLKPNFCILYVFKNMALFFTVLCANCIFIVKINQNLPLPHYHPVFYSIMP